MPAIRLWFLYHSDYLGDYTLLLPYYYQSAYTGAYPWHDGDWGSNQYPFPRGYSLRCWRLVSADGLRRRTFPLDEGGSAMFSSIGATLILPNANGTSETWTIVSYAAESYRPKTLVRPR